MNAEELKASLEEYYAEYASIGVTVYALLKDPERPQPVKLDIESVALESLKALFMQSLREKISENDELTQSLHKFCQFIIKPLFSTGPDNATTRI